jgi:hypothetical protein
MALYIFSLLPLYDFFGTYSFSAIKEIEILTSLNRIFLVFCREREEDERLSKFF